MKPKRKINECSCDKKKNMKMEACKKALKEILREAKKTTFI